jgi:hypothetical protein
MLVIAVLNPEPLQARYKEREQQDFRLRKSCRKS